MNRRVLLLLAAGLLATPSLQAQLAVPDDVQSAIRQRVDQGISVGIVVGVVDAAGTRYFSYGRTAMQGGQPVNEHTVYEIGSITKVFTGVALADMAVRGDVSLDDPVSRYLGGATVPSRGEQQITLRLLSSQRSGLPRLPNNLPQTNPANPYADYTPALLLQFLAGHTLTRDPGAQYEYSNLGVGLLGYALAQRDRTSYEQMVKTRITDPLGMRETMITLTPEARARLAMGHNGGRQAGNWDFGDATAGAGALRSTAADMTRFLSAAMGLTRTPLDSAFALSVRPQAPIAGSPGIGLGWHIRTVRGTTIIWHNGGTGGYRSWAGFDPARRVGVVVLSNSGVSADDLGLHMLDSLFPLTQHRAAIAMSGDTLALYAGQYQLTPQLTFTITREGDALFAQLTGQGQLRVYPSAPNEFFYREVNAQLSFVRDSTGRVTALVLHQNGRDQNAPRVN